MSIRKKKGGWAMGQNRCPIDVISVCSASGEIRPLRFRMEDEHHQLLCVDVDEVISSKEIRYVGIEARVFLCRAVVEERKWLFELKYTIRSHCWTLIRSVT
jgi:hypothetical protein